MKRKLKPIDERKRARLMAKVRAAVSTGMGELGRQADEQLKREHAVLGQEAPKRQ